MYFDDLEELKKIDQENMIDEIRGLPEQLESAWQSGLEKKAPKFNNIKRIIISGMGGSAIGADLMASYLEPVCDIPIFVNRDYDIPVWAKGEETLFIASSHSGNTEETLSAYSQAVENQCSVIAISTGGKLTELAEKQQISHWKFKHEGQPRAAVGFSFGLLMSLLFRLDLIDDHTEQIQSAANAMRETLKYIDLDVSTASNPAKRLAGQIINRWVMIAGGGFLAPVSRRWKTQISEISKGWAQFEFLPEMDHNTLAGVYNPESLLSQTMVLFLQSDLLHPRIQKRVELTRENFMLAGIGTDTYLARGKDRLSQMWTTILFGDFLSYYLAMAYHVDPTPVEALESFKQAMKD